MRSIKSARKQRGVILLEGLIAILIFSMGILAIMGLQAAAVKNSTDVRFRTDAAFLAHQLIAQMWLVDHTSTATISAGLDPFKTGGSAYNAWYNSMTATPALLPNVATYPPTVSIDAANVATITISWRAPEDVVTHQYVTMTQIQ